MKMLQKKFQVSFLHMNLIYAGIILCGLLGAQRILLSPIDAYICIIPLLLSFRYFYTDKPKYHTLILISLFLSVDNGAGIFSETASFIRYIIYLMSALTLLSYVKFDRKKTLIAFIVLLIPITLTLFNLNHLDMGTLIRDLFLVLLIMVVLCRSESTLKSWNIDLELLVGFLNAYLVSEIINIVFFFGGPTTGYLNYDSTKALVILPSLYYMQKNNYIVTFLSILLTLLVLINYGTRMIAATYMAILVLYFILKIVKFDKNKIIFVFPPLLLGLLLFHGFGEILFGDIWAKLETFKFIGSLITISEQVTLESILRAADPVRAIELKLFSERDILHILFGNGFGSGLYDKFGEFGFVSIYQTAFTAGELKSNYYYNLHDLWTDVALRIGLLPVILGIVILLRNITVSTNNTSAIAMLLWVLIFCAFFTSAGLLLIAMIALTFTATRATNLDLS